MLNVLEKFLAMTLVVALPLAWGLGAEYLFERRRQALKRRQEGNE